MPKTVAHSNFTMVSNELIDTHLAQLTRVEGFVFLVVTRKAINGVATVDHKYIAKKVGCKPRAVQRALVRLVKLGFLRIESAKNEGQANSYVLLLRVEERGEQGTSSTTYPKGERASSATQGVCLPRRTGGTSSTTHKYLDRTTTTTKTEQKTKPTPPTLKRAGGVPPWKRSPDRISLMTAMTFEERLPMFQWTEEQWVEQERDFEEMMAYVNHDRELAQ
jgi:hypothetical protein